MRAIQFDPSAALVSSADGPVTGDEDINVIRTLSSSRSPEVVLDQFAASRSGNGIRMSKHVACDEDAALLDQQRRMALGMRRVLDNPDLRAIQGICAVSAGRRV